jgi:thermitase
MIIGRRTSLILFLLAFLFIPHSDSAAQAEFDSRQIIVKLKPGSGLLARSSSGRSLAHVKRMTPIKSDATMRPLPGGVERLFVAEIADGAKVEDVLRQLAANPEVEYAEPDYVMHAHGSGRAAPGRAAQAQPTSGDPDFFWQWGLYNRGLNGGQLGIDVNALPAWEITTGDTNTILAVLDTGIAFTSPDFEGRILPGKDYINNDNDPADDEGHGTNTASVAAATGGNGIAIAGMNWKCRILPIKVLNSNGTGSYSAFAAGFIYAADHGARVINISAGGTSTSQTLATAVAYARSRGVIIVASMGNNNNEVPEYPAVLPGVIAVGAINSKGLRAVPFFTGSGGSNYGNHISFMAPGDMILGINYHDVTQSKYFYGTSDAAPFVAGLVTLMLAVNPTLTYHQVYEALKAGARDQIGLASEDTPGWDKYFGWGLIDAYQSLLAVPGPTNFYFAQAAVGGGYTTTFTFLNTGSEETYGNLTLMGDSGSPLSVAFTSPGLPGLTGSSFQISIPPGGTQTITANPVNQGDPTSAGWARVESSGGSLQGVATFQLVNSNTLTTIVGVLSAAATDSATIPIDDDRTQGIFSRVTGYSVANPGSEDLYIQIVLKNADGSVSKTIDPQMLNPLRPGCHVARFLWEDLNEPNLRFKGSMVLAAQGAKPFSVVALVLNQGLYTAIPVIPGSQAGASRTTNLFAQMAIGGGYTTIYTLLNPGSGLSTGNLILTADDGSPLNATFSSPGNQDVVASSFPVSVYPGGTQIITAKAASAGAGTTAGWARVESGSGALTGVATFQYGSGNALSTIVGVLSADATHSATIPVDDDRTLGNQSRVTGYGVANTGNQDINIRLMLLNPDGTVARTLHPEGLNPLQPGRHVARFLWEDMNDPALLFRGSMVLIADGDQQFSTVALVLNQGLYTAIPVIPASTPAKPGMK